MRFHSREIRVSLLLGTGACALYCMLRAARVRRPAVRRAERGRGPDVATLGENW